MSWLFLPFDSSLFLSFVFSTSFKLCLECVSGLSDVFDGLIMILSINHLESDELREEEGGFLACKLDDTDMPRCIS